jgi:hypothetical protein
MLTELFLTPHAMCPDNIQNIDYQTENARFVADAFELIENLRIYLAPNPPTALTTVCCRLGGEKWYRAVAIRVQHIKNDNIRQRLQSLLTRIQGNFRFSLSRFAPMISDTLSENDWIRHAVQSSQTVPLARIVVSDRQGQNGASPPFFSLEEMGNAAFFSGLESTRPINSISDQKNALSSLCILADEIVLRTPYDRELGVLGKQIIDLDKSILQAGLRANRLKLDVHVCSRHHQNGNYIPDATLARNIRMRFGNLGVDDANLTITLFPNGNFLNRHIIALKYAGAMVRWRYMVCANHILGANDGFGPGNLNTWSVANETDAMNMLNAVKYDTNARVIHFDANGRPIDQHGNPL